MKRFIVPLLLLALVGCRSYSQLKRDCGSTKVDGSDVLAAFEVVNPSYKLFGVLPISCGDTWKTGPYEDRAGSLKFFTDGRQLDDNLASVRHACEVVGSDRIANLVGRDDVYYAWSCFVIRKEVVKTSCVILAQQGKK